MPKIKQKKLADMIEVQGVGDISLQNQAIYEAGNELIRQSLTVGRDYCRFMINTSLSGIPIFISILSFNLTGQTPLDLMTRFYFMIPVILFLSAALIFTFGFLPTVDIFSLDIIEEIEAVRSKTIRRRHVLIRFGIALFLTAVLTACFVLIAIIR